MLWYENPFSVCFSRVVQHGILSNAHTRQEKRPRDAVWKQQEMQLRGWNRTLMDYYSGTSFDEHQGNQCE